MSDPQPAKSKQGQQSDAKPERGKLFLPWLWRWIKRPRSNDIPLRIVAVSIVATVFFVAKYVIKPDNGYFIRENLFITGIYILNMVAMGWIAHKGFPVKKYIPNFRKNDLSIRGGRVISKDQLELIEKLEYQFTRVVKWFFGLNALFYFILFLNATYVDPIINKFYLGRHPYSDLTFYPGLDSLKITEMDSIREGLGLDKLGLHVLEKCGADSIIYVKQRESLMGLHYQINHNFSIDTNESALTEMSYRFLNQYNRANQAMAVLTDSLEKYFLGLNRDSLKAYRTDSLIDEKDYILIEQFEGCSQTDTLYIWFKVCSNNSDSCMLNPVIKFKRSAHANATYKSISFHVIGKSKAAVREDTLNLLRTLCNGGDDSLQVMSVYGENCDTIYFDNSWLPSENKQDHLRLVLAGNGLLSNDFDSHMTTDSGLCRFNILYGLNLLHSGHAIIANACNSQQSFTQRVHFLHNTLHVMVAIPFVKLVEQVLEILTSNLTMIFICSCFLILYSRTLESGMFINSSNPHLFPYFSYISVAAMYRNKELTESNKLTDVNTKRDDGLVSTRLLRGVVYAVTTLAVLQIVFEGISEDFQRDDIFQIFKLISGVLLAMSMFALFARFESRKFNTSLVLIVLLYTYAIIQTFFGLFDVPIMGNKYIIQNVSMLIAFWGKCFLYLYILWIYNSDRLMYYFYRKKIGLDENTPHINLKTFLEDTEQLYEKKL